MLSIDTNVLVYAQNSGCEEHRLARGFLSACRERDVVICELVLVDPIEDVETQSLTTAGETDS